MRTRTLASLTSVLLAGAVLAGCVAPDDDTADADALLQRLLEATRVGLDHDHHTPDGHTASMGMSVLDWATGHARPSTYGEVDARSGIVATAILHQADGMAPGFFLVDAANPAKLDVLGVFADLAPSVYAADLKLSPNAQWLFLAVQPYGPLEGHLLPADLPAQPPWPNRIVDAGVYLFDVSNPASPRLAGYHVEQFRGVHMMFVHEIGGDLYAFLQSTGYPPGVCTPAGCVDETPVFSGEGSRITIAKFETAGAAASLVPVAEYGGVDRHSIHDMTVYDDPDTGQTLMYVAHWDAGVRVVDVSDAPNGNVEEIGVWAPEEFLDRAVQGRIHTVMVDWIDDRRILVATPEYPYWHEVPPTYILDVTDFSDIREIARWRIPNEGLSFESDDPDTPLYRWSPHNINFHDGILFMAHFHAGVWVLDLNQDPANPRVVGHSMLDPPHHGPGALNGQLADSPSVWDAVWHEGTLWVSDINGGLASLKVDELVPAAPPGVGAQPMPTDG